MAPVGVGVVSYDYGGIGHLYHAIVVIISSPVVSDVFVGAVATCTTSSSSMHCKGSGYHVFIVINVLWWVLARAASSCGWLSRHRRRMIVVVLIIASSVAAGCGGHWSWGDQGKVVVAVVGMVKVVVASSFAVVKTGQLARIGSDWGPRSL
ncbi:hypothetical protein J3A83DRAFT_4406821 [Scleroderma citrinum]